MDDIEEYFKLFEEILEEYATEHGEYIMKWPNIIFTPEYWQFLQWLADQPVPSSLNDYYDSEEYKLSLLERNTE